MPPYFYLFGALGANSQETALSGFLERITCSLDDIHRTSNDRTKERFFWTDGLKGSASRSVTRLLRELVRGVWRRGLAQLQLMWVRAAVCGLVANNLGPVADIVVLGHRIVAVNVVP